MHMDRFLTVQHSTPAKKRPITSDENLGPSPKAAKLDGLGISGPTSPASMDSNNSTDKLMLPNGTSRQASPALSLLSSVSSLTTPPSVNELNDPRHSNGPPVKRRKLTTAEKEQKEKERIEQKAKREEERLAKEEERRRKNEEKEENRHKKELERIQKDEEKRRKDEEKEEQRRIKEAEKQQKDEEKRRKDEEKEEQRRIKEAEKQQKEDERRRKEEEKEKKERAQTRLNNFFIKPKTPSKSAVTYEIESRDGVDRKMDPLQDPSPLEDVDPFQKKPQTDYERTFLPFHVGSNSTCAPQNRFSWDRDAISRFENAITKSMQAKNDSFTELNLRGLIRKHFPTIEKSVEPTFSVREIITQLSRNGSTSEPIDLTVSSEILSPLDYLHRIPMKYIHFSQDVRPPYVGTYTQTTLSETLRTARQPFRRVRPDTNYEYDSEAEWEEPEDGEDLNSEGDSEEELEDEDMGEFLDDEDISTENASSRKRFISSDLEPVSTGLCWEDERGKVMSLTNNIPKAPLHKMEALHESINIPIDPFSTKYWATDDFRREENPKAVEASRPALQAHVNATHSAAPSSNHASGFLKGRPTKSSTEARKTISGEDLVEFKRAVDGNDLPKVALLAILKKRFPKIQNAILKETLNAVATRVGKTEQEKSWVLIESMKHAD